MQAVIIAGGKGTRLGQAARLVPKPMVRIGDRPILEHQIVLLKRYGVLDIILVTGHLSEVIEEYFGDGRRWGVNITYYREETPLGTVGALREIENRLEENFIVLYGDVMLSMDLNALIAHHLRRQADATLAVHPNDHPHDSDLVEVDGAGRVTAFHPKPHPEDRYFRNLVNAAVYVMNRRILAFIERGVKADFGRDIFPRIVPDARLFGYNTAEYIKDVGTPERLAEVEADWRRGKIERLNREHPRRAIFLDRDGTLVHDVPLLCRSEDLALLPGAARAIKAINVSEFLAIVATNQPVIARGMCGAQDVALIHNKLETLLGRERAKLDAIYYCPHHPDKGYPGENPLYKIECDCRKPKTGMLVRAAEEYHIDLKNSYMIGDASRDIQCGRNAGLGTVGVRTGAGCPDPQCRPDHLADDLEAAVGWILEQYH